jgi:hypothetical protein
MSALAASSIAGFRPTGFASKMVTDAALARRGMASFIARAASRLLFQPTRMLVPNLSKKSGQCRG